MSLWGSMPQNYNEDKTKKKLLDKKLKIKTPETQSSKKDNIYLRNVKWRKEMLQEM